MQGKKLKQRDDELRQLVQKNAALESSIAKKDVCICEKEACIVENAAEAKSARSEAAKVALKVRELQEQASVDREGAFSC
jgi:hypothetical protein